MATATISELFRTADADAEALVTRSGRWTYRQIDERCDRAAAALWASGVRPGDRVGVCLPNDVGVVLAFHGLMRIGAVWVGVNRNLAGPERQFMLDDSRAGALLDSEEDWLARVDAADPIDLPSVDPEALAAVAYTSGTTGRPKGAMHSHTTLTAPGAALVASRGYDATLRKGDCFPLTILNLQVLSTVLVAQAGGCAIVMDRTDADGVAEWIRRERITTWNGPPALLHSLVERDTIGRADLASLREVWTGGGDCPEHLRERFAAKFGVGVTSTYGLTEAPTVVTIDPPGDHRPGASGLPLPHLALEIVDDEICVGPAAPGSYRPMLGYLDRPEATAEALAGGVLHTGDIGDIDDDGYLHVRDRKSLVIIRGGANVYPAEVERVLSSSPAVAGCAVFGVPDDRLGERVMAVVELTPDAVVTDDDLTSFCLEQLAHYKVPERFAIVDTIPRNAMGKVSRDGLPGLLS